MGLVDFALPLALTLAFEGVFALVWGLRRRDLLLLVLVNVLTNPAVVLLHALFPGRVVTAVLELGAVAVEGGCYSRLGSAVRRPWLFSLCANGFSFCLGLAADFFI
ncbi:MAG: hypothetical protein NC123_11190 [Butyrivibrio sp.]|nr:hypothetical protein [Acetatifactor muris]MCM1560088.1 hypothetical protein [Butyrivibrio sp.]